MKTLIRLFALTFFFSVSGLTQEIIVARHFGSTNPTNEGFTLLHNGNPSLSPVLGDQGLNAWHIGLSSNSDIGQYYRNFTPQQVAEAANGWVLSLTVRVLPPYQNPAFSFGAFGEVSMGTQSFSLLLGASPSGDPIARLGNVEYSLIGGGSGYHNYQLRFDAGIGVASLWVDGSERIGGLVGISTLGSQSFSWGGGQNPYGTLAARWNEASFTIIPEPSSLALCLSSAIIIANRFIRRHG